MIEHVHTKTGAGGRFDSATRTCQLHLVRPGPAGGVIPTPYGKARAPRPSGLPRDVGGKPWDTEEQEAKANG